MGRDEDKLIRQLSLLSFLLSRRRPTTAREVQEAVEGYAEMSDDTFTRRFFSDRADLAKIGIEVRTLTGGATSDLNEAQLYYLSEEDFRLPVVTFTEPECRALAVALAALEGRFAYARPLRLALTAILGGRQDAMTSELEQLPVALAADEDAECAGQQLSRLEEAVTRGKTVRFLYPSGDGAPFERTLDPYSLFLTQGHWYAIGRDQTRGAIRTFRVARIQGSVHFVSEKGRDFSIPTDYDPDRYRARPPWLIGQVRGTAIVRVGDELAWWVERLEPHVLRVGKAQDGDHVFEVPYADDFVLVSWVVGLGTSGELLQPPALRQRLLTALSETARVHEGPGRESATESAEKVRPRSAKRSTIKAAPVAPEHLARAIALLQYLVDENRPTFVSWQTLKDDLGLSRSEVETDLSLINLVNFGGGTYVLTAEAGDDGVEVARDVMADTFARAARLSPVMARALLLALELLGDTFALEGLESLASVRQKVKALAGTGHPGGVVMLDDVLPPAAEIVEVLNRAIRDHSVVALEYFTSSRQELSEREIEPYLLFHSPDGWYLEAFCLRVTEQRTFKLERVRSVRATGAGFVPRSGVDLARRRSGRAFSPDDAAGWAIVRFTPRWATYLKEQGLEYARLADGGYEARIPYLDERWMAQHILGYLGEAVLEAPDSARETVRGLAAGLAARYAGERRPQSAATTDTPDEVCQ
jgi:predicted DNA-binding transcriptional regulator YafY